MKSKGEVSIVKGTKADWMVKHAISLIGGMGTIIKPGSSVLIKPNICLPLSPKMGDSTSPEIVASLIRLSQKAGASKVIVGESACWGLYAPDNFDVSEIGKYAEEAGAELCYFDEEERVDIKIPNGVILNKVSIPKIVKNVDVLINVPKMKNNFVTMVTLGIKICLRYSCLMNDMVITEV